MIMCLALLAGASLAREQEEEPAPPVQPKPTPVARMPAASAVPTAPVEAPARPLTRGSLYVDRTFQSLTSDRRVHRIGDLVTVLIFENASASSTADTGASRDAGVGVGVAWMNGSKNAAVTTNNDFTGVGRTQRAGKILAQLTVAVRDIAPNQDLILAGEQQLEINGEKQVIRLEGRARPRDISELNTVVSTRVADARIAFIGDGVVADRQRPGWWQQLLSMFGL